VENQPLVSVIMPCYNMEKYISDAIMSVRQQTYPYWELLIVDDASTDGTVDIIKNHGQQDNRIHYVVKTKHSGIADSRNQCIKMSQGQYLAFLDADDIWHPEKLETQLKFMTEKKVGFSYSTYDCIDEDGLPLNKTIKAAGNLDYEAYLHNTIIGCSTVMVDTAIVGEVVVPNFRTSEDSATWLNILKKGFIAYGIETPLTSYRIRKRSASSNKIKASIDLWKVYRQQEKLPFFTAGRCFVSYAFNAIKKRLC
jgi:teichuronic acid biosynthesis glycosyltransferase TuaG